MKEKEILSEKQLYVLNLLKTGGLKRINILEGSVRSGKTYVSLILWAFWLVQQTGGAYLMTAKTLTALRRNVLEPLMTLFGDDNFTYSITKKEAVLFGRLIYLEGANDSRSESKIRGMTLSGAYCDELTLIPQDFFTMLLSRLSEPGAKLFATTNPDHAKHWLKTDYLDNPELDLLDVRFTLDDNVYLDRDYVAALKTEFKGLYYDRFIRGLWVAAEGRIYTDFGKRNIISDLSLAARFKESPPIFTVIGVDYGGNRSASVFTLVGFDSGFRNVYALAEYYDAKNESAESLIESFRVYVDKWRCYKNEPKLIAAFCDSAEQLLVKSFRAAVDIDVKNALKKPVNSRINMLCRLIASGRFFVSESCTHLIDALETALWDETRTNCDLRLDDGTTNIDSLDSLEYAIERYERELFRL